MKAVLRLIAVLLVIASAAGPVHAIPICHQGPWSMCYAACAAKNEVCENRCGYVLCTTNCWAATESCYDLCDIQNCYGEV